MTFVPNAALEGCPQLDVVFAPGGAGQVPLMSDPAVLNFLRRQTETKLLAKVKLRLAPSLRARAAGSKR